MLQCLWRGCPVGGVHADLASHVIGHAAQIDSGSLSCHWLGCQRGEKPFSFRYQLHQHVALHANEGQFACQQCGKRFNTETYLRRHLASHQLPEERRHACVVCSKRFAHSADKSRCERGHRGQLHNCRHCGKAFKDPSNLRKHRKRWHSNESAPDDSLTVKPTGTIQRTTPSVSSPSLGLDSMEKPSTTSAEATNLPPPPPLLSAPPQTVVYSSCVLPPISSFTLSKDGALDLTLGVPMDSFCCQLAVDGTYLSGHDRSQAVCGALDLTQSAHQFEAALFCNFDSDQYCPDPLETGPGRPVDLSLPRLEYYS